MRALAFTDHGMQTGERIRELFPQMQLNRCPKGGLSRWTEESFETEDVIIYIGAVGIAVRAIAPHVVSKLRDPAVLVIDELGRFVIPILSGHVGGANAAAKPIADALGATAVITTATDLNGKFAIDVWATEKGLTILDKDGIKEVSSRVLKGENVDVYSRWPISGKMPAGLRMTSDPENARVVIDCGFLPENVCGDKAGDEGTEPDDAGKAGEGDVTLRLAPKCLYVGIGCRKGIAEEAIEEAWTQVVKDYGIVSEAVIGVTSINIKAHEAGLLAFCEAYGWQLATYDKDELNDVPGEFHGSEFVKKTVGVDSVCERSAVLAARNAAEAKKAEIAGPGDISSDVAAEKAAELVVPKTAKNGVTIAVALVKPVLSWT